MKRNASTADFMAPATGLFFEGAVAVTDFLARKPGVVGGATAFAVCFLFVSANAAWYQPYRHPAPFFQTQANPRTPQPTGATATMRIEHAEDADPRDPQVAFVQRALTDLELYTGSIDGVSGPRTRQAVAAFRSRSGLDPQGGIDAALLRRLESGHRMPVPTPRPDIAAGNPARTASEPDDSVAAVQALLVSAGYSDLDIDGLMGSRTSLALRDFQRRKGLEATGAITPTLIKALRKAAPKG